MTSPCDPNQQAVAFRRWANRPNFYIFHGYVSFQCIHVKSIIPDKAEQECTFLKGTILLGSSGIQYTRAKNKRFCKQWKGISFCPPPLTGRLAKVYPFPLVGEFPKPPAEMLTHSCRTPQNVVATLRLQKKKPKAGHYAIASGFPHTLTVLLLLLFLFLLLFFLLFDLKKTIHVGLDRLQFLIFLP